MNFHGPEYAVFLPLVLVAFWLLSPHRRARTGLLLAASLFFYSRWHVWYLSLLVFSTLLDYVSGIRIADARDPRTRKAWLLVSLTGNLGLLGFFKYWDWGVGLIGDAFTAAGLSPPLGPLGIVVPVGISFYTFQTLSYTIDVYRGQVEARRDLLEFALFVSYFPQLVAGPIVRARDFLPQLDWTPRFSRERLHDGLYLIGQGLAKKVLIADVLGRYLVNPVWDEPGNWGVGAHVLALYAFPFQIYGDFSGYTDIAVGSARLFGFDLCDNFLTPFKSRSIREFWQRWHISLSTWVRDYVYFPLGGSRVSSWMTYRNLLITMVLIGLWHGANTTWLVYGILNGIAMSLERVVIARRGTDEIVGFWPQALGWFKQWHFTVITLLMVRGENWERIGGVVNEFGTSNAVSHWGLLALGVAALTHFVPAIVGKRIHAGLTGLPTPALGLVFGAFLGGIAFVNIGDTPYIYFQF